MEQLEVTISRGDVAACLRPLLNTVRNISQTSELVALIVCRIGKARS